MKKPFFINFIIWGLILYALNLYRIAYQDNNLFFLILGAMSFAAAVGLYFNKKWSSFVVYFITVFIVGSWVYVYCHELNRAGWNFDGITDIIMSFLFGISVMLLSIGCSLLVFRYFKNTEN